MFNNKQIILCAHVTQIKEPAQRGKIEGLWTVSGCLANSQGANSISARLTPFNRYANQSELRNEPQP